MSEQHQETITWHLPHEDVDGEPFGACGLCTTIDGKVVLISRDGDEWDLPGGRPEGTETPEETLHRELWEEACVTVNHARLLGFVRAAWLGDAVTGQARVRSVWRADVSVLPWNPQHEVRFRRIVLPAEAQALLVDRSDPYAEVFATVLRSTAMRKDLR